MLSKWKARLRAWLIDLVREAIRIEREQERFMKAMPNISRVIPKSASKPLTTSPVSFEQEEREALKSQEKYYAPAE